MWVYVLIANVVLVNMLIAMFAETYARIRRNAFVEYHYQVRRAAPLVAFVACAHTVASCIVGIVKPPAGSLTPLPIPLPTPLSLCQSLCQSLTALPAHLRIPVRRTRPPAAFQPAAAALGLVRPPVRVA
jgi:hypothetical protein